MISKVSWTGPYAHPFVDVKDPGGAMKNWDVELGSPTALSKRGWSQSMQEVRDSVQRADGSHHPMIRALTPFRAFSSVDTRRTPI